MLLLLLLLKNLKNEKFGKNVFVAAELAPAQHL